ncbi:MAG: nickel pincer cofactor biosynthesis protein LarB [Planctomycetota bacterium]|jgi:NCAIR mutase (PurE)-related protein
MNAEELKRLLERVKDGTVPVEEALQSLEVLPFADLGFARVDHHRALRCGFPEVIFCAGKSPEEAASIAAEILSAGQPLLATRATEDHFQAIVAQEPEAVFHRQARAVTCRKGSIAPKGCVSVVCAGTADIPVAEEARVTAEMMGARVDTFYDVGVAGIHRLLECLESLRAAHALVVVAGMEGALPSVVGGLVSAPVIGVPTSVGYGASFEGLAPLLTMLNSCAAGVSVVNIDNGFGGGYMAALINRGASRLEKCADRSYDNAGSGEEKGG